MTDRENQEDEIEVLQSIFTEDEFQSFKNGDLICGQFNAFVSVPEGYNVSYGASSPSPRQIEQSRESKEITSDKKTISIQYLPPIQLCVTLPQDYPSQTSPKFTITCHWLTWSQLTKVCHKLDQIWEENQGFVVLYLWAQFLKDECLSFLQLDKSLDLTHVMRNALMHEARRLREMEKRKQTSASSSDKENYSKIFATSSGSKDGSSSWKSTCEKEEEEQANKVRRSLIESNCVLESEEVGKSQVCESEESLEVRQSLYERTSSSGDYDGKAANDSVAQAVEVKQSLYEFASNPEMSVLDKNISYEPLGGANSSYDSRIKNEENEKAEIVRQSLYEKSPDIAGHSSNTGEVENSDEALGGKGNLSQPTNSQLDQSEAGPSTSRINFRTREAFPHKYDGRHRARCKRFPRGSKMKPVDHRIISGAALSEPLWKVIIDYNKQRKKRDFNYQMFCCSVCFEEYIGSQCMELDSCGHVFCRDCLSSYLDVSIKEGKVKQLTCPENDCDADLLQSEIKSLVSTELFAKYDSLLLASTLDTLNVTYCPRRFCQYPVSPENETMAICPQCQYCFCIICKMVYHGVEPCRFKLDSEHINALVEEYGKCSDARRLELEKKYGRKHLRDLQERVLSETWILNHSKQCPSCGASIQRTYGCNKMLCQRCGKSFCWLCFAVLSQGNPYSHFNTGRCANKLFFNIVYEEEEGEEEADEYVEEDDDYLEFDDDDIVFDEDLLNRIHREFAADGGAIFIM